MLHPKDTNMLVSFALGNANGFALQWNIGYSLALETLKTVGCKPTRITREDSGGTYLEVFRFVLVALKCSDPPPPHPF